MNRKWKAGRKLLLLCLALAVSLAMAVPASAASNGKLVKEYKYKNYVQKDGKWKSLDGKIKYYKDFVKYDKKKNPVKFTTKEYYKSKKTKSSSVKLKYTYKKGKVVKRKGAYDNFSDTDNVVEYKKGVPANLRRDSGDGYGRSHVYKFKSRYATYVKFTDIDPNVEEGEDATSIMIFKVKTKDGLPVKITGTTAYGYPAEITFYTTGAKKGLIKKADIDTSIERGDYIEIDKIVYYYNYKVKKGLVTKAVRKSTHTFGYSNEEERTVSKFKTEFSFKYSKTKADKKRYHAMINDIVANLGEYDAYGRPVLYTYWY